jgi:hypothetical protein
MSAYTSNRACSCPRCRARGLTGAAILVTLGVLFLLEEFHIARFDETWPVLLIVIGLFLYLSRAGSIEGHIDPPAPAGALPPPPPPPGDSQGPEVHS